MVPNFAGTLRLTIFSLYTYSKYVGLVIGLHFLFSLKGRFLGEVQSSTIVKSMPQKVIGAPLPEHLSDFWRSFIVAT